MVNRWLDVALAGSLLLLLGGCVVAPPPPVIQAPPPAPAVRVEVAPVAPGPTYVWVGGHWAWRGPAVGYAWIPGRYVVPARPAYVWVPGHWAPRPGGYVWVEGHWRPR